MKKSLTWLVIAMLCASITTSCASPTSPSSIPTTVAPAAPGEFTIVLFPDTQNEMKSYHDLWENMAQWVVDNKVFLNIQAVIGLGDVTNDHTTSEFKEALVGWDNIDASGVPYIPIIGNHDYNDHESRKATSWNTCFGTSRFSSKSWYGGSYQKSTENWWIKFDFDSHKYLVMGLEFLPRTNVLSWAQDIVDVNPDREVIIATHAYLTAIGRLSLATDRYMYGVDFGNDGQNLWDSFIKSNPMIIAVVGGHFLSSIHTASLVGVDDAGNLVTQFFTNYQTVQNGGNGYLSLMTFNPSAKIINITTYSPHTQSYDSTGSHVLPYGAYCPSKGQTR
jgi:hypothetical protein